MLSTGTRALAVLERDDSQFDLNDYVCGLVNRKRVRVCLRSIELESVISLLIRIIIAGVAVVLVVIVGH